MSLTIHLLNNFKKSGTRSSVKTLEYHLKIYLNKDGSTSLDFKPNSSIAVKLLDFKKFTKNLIASLENKDINSLVSYIKRSIKPYFREEIKKYIQKMITGFSLKDLEEKNSPILLKDIDNEYLKWGTVFQLGM